MMDRRNIDGSLGILSGEGSHMAATEPGPWPAAQGVPNTYYNHPVVRKSPWGWDVPAYYYVGGTTGGLMTLGAAATLVNREELAGLITKARWMATAGATVSAVLLIHDLGRPMRFLYMLRVFRPTSPMSVGTWILIAFSGLTGLSAITQRWRWLSDPPAVLAGVLGLALSGYTGVLVSNTAVPVWQQPHKFMPILFLASATSSAASFFNLLPANTTEQKIARWYGIAGKVVEVATVEAIEREVGKNAEVARPLKKGVSGKLWQAGKILTGASLLLALVPKPSRALIGLTGICGTAGAICMRFGIHYAGQASAENPQATFQQQRAGNQAQ